MIDEMAEKLQQEHGIEAFVDLTSSNQVNEWKRFLSQINEYINKVDLNFLIK